MYYSEPMEWIKATPLENIAALGLVVVRSFLSWSQVVEVGGRWTWQARHAAAKIGGISI